MTPATGSVLWFTGLSGAGKTTLATGIAPRLKAAGLQVLHLDGDRLRQGLCADLGFEEADRRENLRRAAEVASLLVDEGLTVLASFISPFQADRLWVRRRFKPGQFAEIHVHCPLEVCAIRDPKGLYARATRGGIPHFTGVSAPYEFPEAPDLRLETHREDLATCLRRLEQWVLHWQATRQEAP